jgi:hypothetical protein
MYLSAVSSVEITTYRKKEREREREKEQKDVSNRQDNGLSKSDIQRRGKSMIDECVSRNFGEKRFDINMTASIE